MLSLLGTNVLPAYANEEATPNIKNEIQLQVLVTSLKVYERQDESSLVLYEFPKGNLLDVVEQSGDWFKIKVTAEGLTGWVHQVPAEYGDLSVSVLPSKGKTRFAHEEVGATSPEDTPQTNQFRPVEPNQLATLPPIDPNQVPAPQANLPRESVSIPDRWRLMQALGFKFPWYDPYHQNELKGDLPVLKQYGDDIFFNLGVISDTVAEFRRVATPIANGVVLHTGSNNTYGKNQQQIFVENLILSFDITKGDTTFKPPEYEFKFVPVINYNYAKANELGALYLDQTKGNSRTDGFLGIQELFADIHLRNVSDRYDFDSIRVGIQPFTSDFRGFLFQDSPFGVRIFGNRDNNQYQYNLAWFRRFEKDTNSGLNDVGAGLRDDDVFIANLYKQDYPVKGFTSQVSVIHNRNNETDQHYDANGFLVRPILIGDHQPHRYQVTYLGYTGDGHLGKWNLSTSNYLAIGHDSHNSIAGKEQDIFAGFHASEISRDFDWIRIRGSLMLASGDKNPNDGKSTGFDAILENPQFAGASTSYFIRQGIPLIGGGGVALSGRNGLLASLRSSKDEGQSNFLNPGLFLLGIGADFDLSPQLRVFTNISNLRFMNTSSLATLLQQPAPPKELGIDASVGFHWRPLFNQNIIINGSAAVLTPGDGLKAIYGPDQGNLYSVLFNAVLTY